MNKLQAADEKLKKYSTGKSCKKGHLPLRYTASGACVGCTADYAKRARQLREAKLQAAVQGKVLLSIQIYDKCIPALTEYIKALNFAHELGS